MFLSVLLRMTHLWPLHSAIGYSKYLHVTVFPRFPFPLIEAIRRVIRFSGRKFEFEHAPNLFKHVPNLQIIYQNIFKRCVQQFINILSEFLLKSSKILPKHPKNFIHHLETSVFLSRPAFTLENRGEGDFCG